MKTDKKKIVFAGVLLLVVGFMIAYGLWAYGGDATNDEVLKNVKVPKLGEELPKYENRLEAVNAMKEVRESNAPSIYDEDLLDSTGLYVQNLRELNRQRLLDSIYESETLSEAPRIFDFEKENAMTLAQIAKEDATSTLLEIDEKMSITAKELGLEQQLFFASNPKKEKPKIQSTSSTLAVVVSGTQTVRANDRLQLRTVTDAIWNGIHIPAHSLMYALVKFQPNRVLLEISQLNGISVQLKAFDILDGREGIFVKNSYQQEAASEVIDDVVQDIELPGVPQLRGLKNVFRRSNRKVKVTVYDNYQLLLKATK
jgi:hypothetical protein